MKYNVKEWAKQTIGTGMNHSWQVLCIYIVQVTLALIVGGTVYNALHEALGHSTGLAALEKGFDRTVFSDMINRLPSLFAQTESWVVSLVLLYVFVATLLQGGLIVAIHHKHTTFKAILKNGLDYFLPFFGLSALSVLLSMIVGLLIFVPFFLIIGFPLDTFDTEKSFLFWLLFLFVTMAIFHILIWSWNIASKYHYIKHKNIVQAWKQGFTSLKIHFARFLGLGLGLVFIHILIMVIFTSIIHDRGANSWFVVIFSILAQQVVAFLRVFLRCVGYSGIRNFMKF